MDDYATECYKFLVHNDIVETEDELVSRYITGMCIQFHEVLNMFDPVQKAL